MRAQASMTTDAKLLPVKDASRISGLSRSRLYLEMRAGSIRYKNVGGRRLLVTESVLAFVDAIPDAQPRGAAA